MPDWLFYLLVMVGWSAFWGLIALASDLSARKAERAHKRRYCRAQHPVNGGQP